MGVSRLCPLGAFNFISHGSIFTSPEISGCDKEEENIHVVNKVKPLVIITTCKLLVREFETAGL